jgi:hypothetical protein
VGSWLSFLNICISLNELAYRWYCEWIMQQAFANFISDSMT